MKYSHKLLSVRPSRRFFHQSELTFDNPGDRHPPKKKSPWSIFDASELENKTVRTKLIQQTRALIFRLGQTERRDRRTPETSGREEISTIRSREW